MKINNATLLENDQHYLKMIFLLPNSKHQHLSMYSHCWISEMKDAGSKNPHCFPESKTRKVVYSFAYQSLSHRQSFVKWQSLTSTLHKISSSTYTVLQKKVSSYNITALTNNIPAQNYYSNWAQSIRMSRQVTVSTINSLLLAVQSHVNCSVNDVSRAFIRHHLECSNSHTKIKPTSAHNILCWDPQIYLEIPHVSCR